jgi:tRNA nucleotidyltransferase/poly(A) polymerase
MFGAFTTHGYEGMKISQSHLIVPIPPADDAYIHDYVTLLRRVAFYKMSINPSSEICLKPSHDFDMTVWAATYFALFNASDVRPSYRDFRFAYKQPYVQPSSRFAFSHRTTSRCPLLAA